MTMQTNLLEAIAEGERLKQLGLQKAVDHAETVDPGWKAKAWETFKQWVSEKPVGYRFMMEGFRLWATAQNTLSTPPSKRAFGFLPQKAAREGLIRQDGTAKVQNEKAHRANAAVWVRM
jgi:hypothetical protein